MEELLTCGLCEIGPNEVTLFTADAFVAVHGPGSTFKKGDWYDFLLPNVNMHTTRDKVVHDQRRRIWDHGFSMKGELNEGIHCLISMI